MSVRGGLGCGPPEDGGRCPNEAGRRAVRPGNRASVAKQPHIGAANILHTNAPSFHETSEIDGVIDLRGIGERLPLGAAVDGRNQALMELGDGVSRSAVRCEALAVVARQST
jgi:hypothetical protein